MHRKVKGLLSLILTIAMVSVSAVPALAEEQPGEQPLEEQSIVEMAETEAEPAQEQETTEAVLDEAQPAEETEPAQTQPTEETEFVDTQTTEETAPEEEQQTAEQNTTEAAADPIEEQPTGEQPAAETVDTEPASAEPSETGTESALSTEAELETWYDSLLTAEQKQFRVYSGTQPLSELIADADILSKLTFMSEVMNVTPDSEDLNIQSGTLIKGLLFDHRPGDLNFYSLYTWNVWSVDSNGTPQSVIKSSATLSKLATKTIFLQSAYMKNNGVGTDPQIELRKPILEPVWSCIPYEIPVYDGDENNTGTIITVTAENYNNLEFPLDVKADSWKLVYAGTEYELNSASEIWTNQTNGIKAIGRDFDVSQAKLQAVVSETVLQEGTAEFVQPNWYEGQPMAAPIVSSETNGTENITYFYKEKGADDSTYTTTVPEKAGAYTAAAVFAATELYKEVIVTSDFEILPNIPVEETDKDAPLISGVSDGQTYYGNQTVTVTDDHLKTVTVNGEAVVITDNRAEITLKPSEDVYKIVAADEADNRVEYTVEVLETWVRDGINDNGIKKLRRERIYKLGGGKWTIDGDSTVYSGGGSFYVKNGGEYNFKRK